MSVVHLSTAEAPMKQEMLDQLDRLRGEIERGEVIALVLMPLMAAGRFQTRCTSDIDAAQLTGLIAVAHADAVDMMRAQ